MDFAVVAFQAILLALFLYLFALVPMIIAGVKDLITLACAPLISSALIGLLSFLSPFISWNPVSLFFEFIAFCLLAYLYRFIKNNKPEVASSIRSDIDVIISDIKANKIDILYGAAGILVAFALMVLSMSGLSLDSPIGTQNYDNPFHYSVVRHIIESGVSSPIGAGSVMGSKTAIYPDLWHAITALVTLAFSDSIPVAGWTTSFALLGILLPLGLVLMAKMLFPNCDPALLLLAAIGFEITNYTVIGFISFGSLFANLYGVSILPFAVALSVNALCSSKIYSVKSQVLICVSCIIGLGLAHPSTVFVYGIILIPMIISQVKEVVWKVGISIGSAGLWVLLFNSSFFARTVNCIDRTGTDIETGMKYAQRLGINYDWVATNYWILAVLSVIFLSICIFAAYKLHSKWKTSWYLVSIGFLLVLTLVALFPLNPFSVFLTGFWYRDEVRLRAITLYLLIPLLSFAGVIICNVISNLFSKNGSNKKILALWVNRGLLAILIIGFCFLGFKTAWKMHQGYSYATSPSATLTSNEIEFMEEVNNITKGEVVLNNFDDNSVWMYPAFDINALIKGRAANQMSAMDEDLCTVIEGISEISSNSEVAEAADKLSLKWVAKMSESPCATTRFNNIGQIEYKPCDSILDVNANTNGFKLVYELDGMRLYEII